MSKVNFFKKFEELQKIQNLLRNARPLVERELGRKVLDAYLEGQGKEEIFNLVKHIVSEVYGYDQIRKLKKSKEREVKKEKKEQGNEILELETEVEKETSSDEGWKDEGWKYD